MTGELSPEKWAPVYSEDDLKNAIDCLSKKTDFFIPKSKWTQEPFQYDIFKFDSLPGIFFGDEEGNLTALPHDSGLWALISPNCDLDNSDHILMAPIISEEQEAINPGTLSNIKSYKTYDLFYYPNWITSDEKMVHFADLSKIINVKREYINQGSREVRLNIGSWSLFNAIVIRFFARAQSFK